MERCKEDRIQKQRRVPGLKKPKKKKPKAEKDSFGHIKGTKKQYTWDSFAVTDMCTAKYDYLPECLTNCIREVYKDKCKLKYEIEQAEEAGEDPGDKPYLYAKTKNRLNGIFGMMYTDPVKEENTIKTYHRPCP